jgi:hypothetical protein
MIDMMTSLLLLLSDVLSRNKGTMAIFGRTFSWKVGKKRICSTMKVSVGPSRGYRLTHK